MKSKYVAFLFLTVYLLTTPVASTKDLILGRSYVVPADTYEETFNLLKLGTDGTTVQQILYAVFTTVQAIIGVILNLVCSLIPPATAIVEALRASVLEGLISAAAIIFPVISVAAPELAVVLEVVQVGLDAGNQLLYNGTIIVQDYGCTTIQSINGVVSSIVDSIIGVF